MTTYIVHPGTGTIISAGDDLVVIETDLDFDDIEYNLNELIDSGRKLIVTDENGVTL